MEQELCKICNQPKEMYYKLYCHRCEKPERETLDFYNLYRCLYHIEAIGNPGYKDRMWEKLVDDIEGNDTHFMVENKDEPDFNLLFETFNITEEYMTFFVSW